MMTNPEITWRGRQAVCSCGWATDPNPGPFAARVANEHLADHDDEAHAAWVATLPEPARAGREERASWAPGESDRDDR